MSILLRATTVPNREPKPATSGSAQPWMLPAHTSTTECSCKPHHVRSQLTDERSSSLQREEDGVLSSCLTRNGHSCRMLRVIVMACSKSCLQTKVTISLFWIVLHTRVVVCLPVNQEERFLYQVSAVERGHRSVDVWSFPKRPLLFLHAHLKTLKCRVLRHPDV
jgi:hypothetical protein